MGGEEAGEGRTETQTFHTDGIFAESNRHKRVTAGIYSMLSFSEISICVLARFQTQNLL